MKLINSIRKNWPESLIIVILLAISLVAHSFNMFHFPYYENDEGVYMSQAWSIIKFGNLAPYTYWYDHAPAGWIFIALWNVLSGGFFTFGFSINSGRVFMLLLHIASSLFLYFIAREITKNKWAGIISVLIFSLSPLGIYFQRRVLLDNIMVFWILLSFAALIYYKNRLSFVVISAISFGIAILTKETAIFLIPPFVYHLFTHTHHHHKRFALTHWVGIMGSVVVLYILYAVFKGEFFPYGGLFGGDQPHVSLIESLKFQAGRGGGSILDLENSSFWHNFRVWVSDDPFIIYAGILATFINLFIGIKNKTVLTVALLSVFFWIYIMRGGLVIEFYIIPLIPFFALNIGIAGAEISRLLNNLIHVKLQKAVAFTFHLCILTLVVLSSFYYSTNVRNVLNIYKSDQTTPQIEGLNWILAQDIPNAVYIIDNYGYIDLQENKKYEGMRTEWYWKVDRDSEIRQDLLKNDRKNVDFIVLTPQMKNDIAYSGLGLSLDVWKHSRPITSFSKDFWSVDIWGSEDPDRILKSSWASYKKHFVQGGRVIDPNRENISTSEGQSYSLLRSVWMNDKESFDEVWKWTKTNLQQPSNLFTWKWNEGSSDDQGTAPDADTDIALALIFASRKWNDNSYLNEGKKIIDGIWNNEIGFVQSTPYIIAGNWANKPNYLTINPSYLRPYAYRIFAELDKNHDWNEVVNSSYLILDKCTSSKLDKPAGKLPPEWCAIDKSTSLVYKSPGEPNSTDYAYNAFRVPWHISLDYKWYKDERSLNYLKSLSVLETIYIKDKKLLAAYTHDGEVWENYESVAAYSGNLGYFTITDNELLEEIYREKILNKFYEETDRNYWEDPKNYFTQNWGWFGTALYSDNLPNLWSNN